jgi:predicted nucleic acid-binding protein
MRIYIDTSVVGGYYDLEFKESTKLLFNEVTKGAIVLVVSDLLELELLQAPSHVKMHLKNYPDKMIEKVELTKEAKILADHYINEKVVGKTSRTDCEHIAIATISKVDVLVSWNFKHIVNLHRIRGYNSINLRLGYPLLEIRSPIEILNK